MSRPTTLPDWATNSTYGAGSRPWNGQPNKTAPSAGVSAEGFDPENPLYADFVNWLLNNHGQWIDYLDLFASQRSFCDGSDGALTFDGTSTVAGLVPSGGVYTMTRHLYSTTMVVTGAGTKLVTNGFIPFATISITTASGGSISNDGANASGSSAGGNGGAGAASTGNGVSSSSQTNTLSTAAGKGGAGGGDGTNTGGSAGTLTTLSDPKLVHIYNPPTMGYVFAGGAWTAINPGSGGGGGSANGAGSVGGGGGGSGGLLLIAARQLILAGAGDVHCAGGTGAAGVHTGGSAGGGGGGGGGTLIAVYSTCNQTLSAATNCAGGSGGAGAGTGGVAGTTGANGNLVTIQLGA